MASEGQTLRIQLKAYSVSFSSFSTFLASTANTIANLVIEQQRYFNYAKSNFRSTIVQIPHTIENLTEVRHIRIQASIETLPKTLSLLKKLEVLELTGCYTLLSITQEIIDMPNLKIKIDNVISPASKVLLIGVPQRGVAPDIFSNLSDEIKNRKISQLIIHQESADTDTDIRDIVHIPIDLAGLDTLESVFLRGNIYNCPYWVYSKNVKAVGLSGEFKQLPGSDHSPPSELIPSSTSQYCTTTHSTGSEWMQSTQISPSYHSP